MGIDLSYLQCLESPFFRMVFESWDVSFLKEDNWIRSILFIFLSLSKEK